MIKTELMRYYHGIVFQKGDKILENELRSFHDENKELPTEEYVKKLEEQFGRTLKHLHRVSESKYLESVSISLMWVRAFVIISFVAGLIWALVFAIS